MGPERYRLQKQLFLEAVERTGEARHGFLRERCGGDVELLEAVLRMIEADQVAGDALEAVTPLAELDAASSTVPLPAKIDEFEVIRLLGRGGIGVVYEARQRSPQRRVAIKVLQSPFSSDDVRARFAREAELLGRLQHAGIAQVFTSGSWESPVGPQPFLAMEFVDGVSVTEFAETRELGDRARIELIVAIADAVEHAHERGVIHRDLKPANVLVTPEGQPKVLDFGVARAAELDDEDRFGKTLTGQVMGTPAYMSPEQATGRTGLVDARADVHALGVMLYELLTGELPRPVRGMSVAESLRVLGEADPGTLRGRRPDLRGDLDTVVAKAVETEVSDRYPDVGAMAADLRRFLADLPIEARPPSTLYQFQKFARRNRVLVAGVVAVMVALALGLVGTLFGLNRSIAERDEARREALKARTTLEFFQETLAEAKPSESLGHKITVEELLDRAAATLAQNGVGEPEVEAALRFTVGSTYRALSRFDAAREHLERAVAVRRESLGSAHLDTADALFELGKVHQSARRFGEARAALQEVLAVRRELLPAPNRELAAVIDSLGAVARDEDDLETAERFMVEALEMRRALFDPPHDSIAASLGHLGQLRTLQSRFDDSEGLLRESLQMRVALHGERHPQVASARNNLASLLQDRAKFDEAARMYELALASNRALHEGSHLSTAQTLNNYGSLQADRGEHEHAESLFLESLAMRVELLGDDVLAVATVHNNLGMMFVYTGEHERARDHLQQALAIQLETLPKGHRELVVTYANLAAVQYQSGDAAGAAEEFRKALEQAEPDGGIHSWMSSALSLNYANALAHAGQVDKAIEVGTETSDWRLAELGLTHADTCLARANLGAFYCAADQFERSEEILLDNWRNLESAESSNPRIQEVALRACIKLYDEWGRPEYAEVWKARLSEAPESAKDP